MSEPGRLIFVEDDDALRRLVAGALTRRGWEVVALARAEDALADLASPEGDADVLLTDVVMPGLGGLRLCRQVREERPEIPVVVLTGFGSMETAVEAIRAGAWDFVTKPVDIDTLTIVLDRALEHRRLRREVRRLRRKIRSSEAGDLIGESGPWLELQQRWAGPEGHRILVADLSGRRSMAQLRLAVAGPAPGLHALGWRLLDPVWEPGARDEAVPLPPAPPVSVERSVSPPLLGIGVVPREDWGASASQCTTPENTWYRFAIHHTAGNITSSGTVQGAVQALQAYAMGAGGWCDIPYQFLVGYDGSLWEGRSLD